MSDSDQVSRPAPHTSDVIGSSPHRGWRSQSRKNWESPAENEYPILEARVAVGCLQRTTEAVEAMQGLMHNLAIHLESIGTSLAEISARQQSQHLHIETAGMVDAIRGIAQELKAERTMVSDHIRRVAVHLDKAEATMEKQVATASPAPAHDPLMGVTDIRTLSPDARSARIRMIGQITLETGEARFFNKLSRNATLAVICLGAYKATHIKRALEKDMVRNIRDYNGRPVGDKVHAELAEMVRLIETARALDEVAADAVWRSKRIRTGLPPKKDKFEVHRKTKPRGKKSR